MDVQNKINVFFLSKEIQTKDLTADWKEMQLAILKCIFLVT